MPNTITVNGGSEKEIKEKKQALEILETLDADVLTKMSKFAGNEKAISYFKSTLKFATLKAHLGLK